VGTKCRSESGVETIERLRAALGAPIPAFVITGEGLAGIMLN
jgi:hypothetical protein